MGQAFKHQFDGWEEREDGGVGGKQIWRKREKSAEEAQVGWYFFYTPPPHPWADILNALAGSKTLGR